MIEANIPPEKAYHKIESKQAIQGHRDEEDSLGTPPNSENIEDLKKEIAKLWAWINGFGITGPGVQGRGNQWTVDLPDYVAITKCVDGVATTTISFG